MRALDCVPVPGNFSRPLDLLGPGLELSWTDPVLATAIPHEIPELPNAQLADFVHPYQQRCTDRQSTMTYFADDRWCDFQFS